MADRRKRARTTGVSVVRARRPIDKSLINVAYGGLNATQQTTVLITATFPCTVVGLRWSFGTNQDGGTGLAQGRWSIIINRDGSTINTMSSGVGTVLYEPEQDVLAFGAWQTDNNVQGSHFDSSTKTMRKLQGGDELVFLATGAATNTSSLHGVVQFFCKS